jgi:nicotinate-nucleotide adenylyltransferase
MALFTERLAGARALAGRHRRLRASDAEFRLGTRYTADTLAALRRRFPRLAFVWLMGADNLNQVAAWERWQEIFNTTPVAVFARPSYSSSAVAAKAAQRFAGARIAERAARTLAGRKPPAWVFIHGPLVPVSATAIREGRHKSGARARSGAERHGTAGATAAARSKERSPP